MARDYGFSHRTRDGYDDPEPDRRDRRRRDRRDRPYIAYHPDPDGPDGWPRAGMPLNHDHEITYRRDPPPDESALDGALYGDGILPLFSGVRDEMGGTPRRDDDLPDDLDPLVDGLDLDLSLPDLDGGRF